MEESAYLEKLRKETDLALWVLFLTDVVLTFVFSSVISPDQHTAWAIRMGIEVVMTTLFVLRRNWVRAALFGYSSLLFVLQFAN